MAELYLFSQDDEFLNILTEDEGLVDTWFKDYENHLIDEPFVFHVRSNSPLLEHIKDENQVAFYDRDSRLRLARIKEMYEVTNQDGNNIRVKCEPSFLELYDHFIEDKRITNGSAQTALDRALEGSRYTGYVTVDLGNATDNFYWIDGIEALFKILGTWGGALKDTITLNDDNVIIERKLWIVQRLGTDNGLLVEPDYNAESISRNTLSYPETALYGQGASLPMEDDDGEHTGGYTRYITFEDVEWSVANGDPVDKPKGQKWVGDPDALARDGYLHGGVRKHRYGHFSNQEYEEPEELLWATWQELQERKLKEIIHEATIYESDKKISLGDTVTILNREYNQPIELQSQITGLEYDILYPDDEIKIVVGKYIDMSEDPLQKEVDDLKEVVNRPRPERPINNDSFPDVTPGTPVNVSAEGSFQAIHLFWDYDSNVYISHYEVYGSQISDFMPDEQHLLYRGRVSAFIHEVETDETWYYYVRAVNTRGTAGEFSNRVEASSVRINTPDILFGSVTADLLENNLDLANQLSEGTLDWINEDPLYQIEQTENRILNDVGNRIGDVLNDIENINDDVGNLFFQDTQINERIDGISTTVQETTGALDDLTGDVEHHTTQISNWEQRADGFEQSVVNVEGSLENAWTEISAFQQTATDLTLSIGELWTDFEDLEIGGRNLLSNSRQPNNGTSYNVVRLFATEDFVEGQVYTAVLKGDVNADATSRFRIWQNEGRNSRSYFNRVEGEKGLWVAKFESVAPIIEIGKRSFYIYNAPSSEEPWEFEWVTLYKGDIKPPLDWSPAPEDMADRANLISYINLSSEGVRIHGDKVSITGQTHIEEGVIGTAAIAELAVDKFHLKYGIIENVHIEDATIEHGKMKSLNVDHVVAGKMDLSYLKAGEIDTDKFLVRGGSAIDYAMIDGSFVELRGRHKRTWQGSTTTHDVKTRLQHGHIRFRNDVLDRSLYLTEYGFSTYLDGEGEIGSSGSIYWWDTEHSPTGQRGITVNSYGGTAALVSERHHALVKSLYSTTIESTESNVQISTHTDHSNSSNFTFTKSADRREGYIIYGANNTKGLRFGYGNSPIVQVIDRNNATGGDTTIEAGNGQFNALKRRSGNLYLNIVGEFFKVGRDSAGAKRVASEAIYERTYSSGANMHITSALTLGRSTSARKYKRDIEPITIEHAYNFFDNVTPIFYRPHNTHDENMNHSHYGYIADDVALFEPRLVQFGQNGEPESFNYDRVPTLLHVVLKHEKLRVDSIEKVVNKLDDDVEWIKIENQYLQEKVKQLEEMIA